MLNARACVCVCVVVGGATGYDADNNDICAYWQAVKAYQLERKTP